MVEERVAELVEMTTAELDARVRALVLEVRAAEAELATALAVVEARKDYEADGHRSMHGYVKATVNCGGGEATRLVRRGRLVNEEPELVELWSAGHIGTAQADRLARASQHPRAGHAFRDDRDELVDHAEHLAYDDFQTVVTRFETLADVDGAADESRVHLANRSATVTASQSGLHIAANGGDPLRAAEMAAVFERARQAEFDADCAERRRLHGDDATDHPLPRTAAQRSFDALYAIFLRSVSAPADGRRPEPLVNILLDGATAGDVLHAHGLTENAEVFGPRNPGRLPSMDPGLLDRRCETTTGIVVHPDQALTAMVHGRIRRVVLDSAGVVIDLGREQRLFTGKARDAATLLVARCSVRGCSVPAAFCDVDHHVEWESEGPTSPHNGGPMCGSHNRHKHRRRLRTRRTVHGDVRLVRADGTTVKPAGEREPRWADEHDLERCRTVSWVEHVSTGTWSSIRPHRRCPSRHAEFELLLRRLAPEVDEPA